MNVNPRQCADARPLASDHVETGPVSHSLTGFLCKSEVTQLRHFHAFKTRARGSWASFKGEIYCREYIWHLFCSSFCLGDKWENIFPLFFCQEFITSVDIYLPWTEISADTCDALHRAYHNDGCSPERNASTIHTCSLLLNMPYFFLSPCPQLLENIIVLKILGLSEGWSNCARNWR